MLQHKLGSNSWTHPHSVDQKQQVITILLKWVDPLLLLVRSIILTADLRYLSQFPTTRVRRRVYKLHILSEAGISHLLSHHFSKIWSGGSYVSKISFNLWSICQHMSLGVVYIIILQWQVELGRPQSRFYSSHLLSTRKGWRMSQSFSSSRTL